MKSKARQIFLVILFSCFCNKTSAQEIQKKTQITSTYFGINLSRSITGMGVGWNANILFSKNIGFNIDFNSAFFKARELPVDHLETFAYYPLKYPMDILKMSSVRLVKEFPTRFWYLRLGAEAGVSHLKYTRSHFEKYQTPSWANDNYFESYTYHSGMGVSLKTKITCNINDMVGVELAAISNINKYQSFVSGSFQLNIGFLDSTKKLKNK